MRGPEQRLTFLDEWRRRLPSARSVGWATRHANYALDLRCHFREDRLSLEAIGSNLTHALADAHQLCEQGRGTLSMSTYHVDNCLSLLLDCVRVQLMDFLASDRDTDKGEHVPFESLHV